jgi:hypothetical protein
MSIIYDALKRVEEAKGANVNAQIAHLPDLIAVANKTRVKNNRSKIYVFLVSLALLVFFAEKVYINYTKGQKTTAAVWQETKVKETNIVTPAQEIVSPPLEQEVKEILPLPPELPAAPVYNLEGIIFDSALPMAIINGKMVKKGDTIGDSQVSEITATAVELLNLKDNTKFTLSL